MKPYEHGVATALTKLGMLSPTLMAVRNMGKQQAQPQQPQQPQQSSGGGIGGLAKNIFSGGLAGTGGLLSGGMGIPGTGGMNPMMGKMPPNQNRGMLA